MPRTLKQLEGHVALGLSVRPFVHPAILHTFETSHVFGDMYARVLKFVHALLMKKKPIYHTSR